MCLGVSIIAPRCPFLYSRVAYKSVLCYLTADILTSLHLHSPDVFAVAVQTNTPKCYSFYYASSLRAMTPVHDLQDKAGGTTSMLMRFSECWWMANTRVVLIYPAVNVGKSNQAGSPSVFLGSQQHEWRRIIYMLYRDAGLHKSLFVPHVLFSCWVEEDVAYTRKPKKNILQRRPCSELSDFIGNTVCFLIRYRSRHMQLLRWPTQNHLFNDYCSQTFIVSPGIILSPGSPNALGT